jgi:predicted nucleic acid-binding protein
LDEKIAQKTIDIRKRFPKNPKLPDAIIASTAIVYDFTLITSDKIGFTKIPELKFINPLSA